MNFKKFEVYGKPTLQQGGWVRTGEGDNYMDYAPDHAYTYYYRICTLDYVPQHHPTQITITYIASKELEVSVIVLRSDNYIIASLGWQDNGYTFNLGSTYDKLGVMFRFKNGDVISPNQVSFDIVGDWHDIPYYIHKTATDTLTLPAVIYPNDTSITVGVKGNTGGVGDLVESGEHAGEYVIPIVCNSVITNIYRNAPLDISDSLTTSIPCTAGENTLDVQTTVQPSEVTVNYKGWHAVADVHERENGQWD